MSGLGNFGSRHEHRKGKHLVVMVSSSSVGNLTAEILYVSLHGSEAGHAREGLIALSGLFAEINVWEEMDITGNDSGDPGNGDSDGDETMLEESLCHLLEGGMRRRAIPEESSWESQRCWHRELGGLGLHPCDGHPPRSAHARGIGNQALVATSS